MKKSIFIIFIFITVGIFAQISTPNTIPPSPNAQTFLKHGDFPVTNYLGIPDVNIPLYNISLKDISVPISISYNTSGIKVSEEASRVGLGWALNAGGIITHTIMGRYNDFHDRVYFNSFAGNNISDLTGIYPFPLGFKKYTIGNYSSDLPFQGPDITKYDFWCALSGDSPDCGGVELAPDIFNYYFMGYSGKFIFSHSGNIVKEKEDNLIIELTSQDTSNPAMLKSWKITAPDGTKYHFNQPELCLLPNNKKHNSSFYLTSIETINGTVVNFSYSKRTAGLGVFNKLEGFHQNNHINSRDVTISYATYDILVLDKISFPNGEARFEYAFDRIDCQQEPLLKTIIIKETTSDQFKWEFDYGYFTSNINHNEMPTLQKLNSEIPASINYYNDTWNRNRLKLISVRKTSMTASPSLAYKFVYNETSLPTKLSMSKDHWEYFNGKNNTSLIPSFIQKISDDIGNIKTEYGGIGGSDREASESHCQAFSLKEITYPTGGKTIFTYESNKYKTGDFENDPYKKDFMYSTNECLLETEPGEHNAGPDWNKSESFTLGNATASHQVYVKFKIWIDLSYTNRLNKVLNLGIYSSSGNPHWTYTYTANLIPTGSSGIYHYENSWNISLPPGSYTLKASGNMISCIDLLNVSTSSLVYPDDYLSTKPFSLGGGLRIKKIQSINQDGVQVSGKRFVYTNDGAGSETQTSGKLMFYPRYRNKWNSCSSSGIRGDGYSVGYSKVHVIDLDVNGDDSGKIVYEFENIPDLNLFYTWEDQSVEPNSRRKARDENPSGIGGYKHCENGTILKESIYKKGSSTPVKETIFEYIGLGGGPYIIWGVLKSDFVDYWNANCLQNCTSDCLVQMQNQPKTDLAFGYFYPAIRPMKKNISTKIEIFNENSQIIKRITNYQYNSKDYINKVTLSSNNNVLKTVEYKYPNDIQGNSIMNELVNTNRIDRPVETKWILNESSQRLVDHYDYFNGKPQIINRQTDTGDGKVLEKRVNYNDYDSYGNPTSIAYEGGPAIVYIWGYRGQCPVAKIETVSTSGSMLYPLICDLIGAPNLSILNNPTDAQVRNIFTDLKNSTNPYLQGALITIYTYKPLTGMTSKTDPNGIITYYEYDIFGRLWYIKDHNGKVIEEYNYHYKQ